ncbi:MAG: YbjN domain-containing protein [Chloroflexi bacterium]|nr:YbjN domain-containing protein [Chloroflexota bacterium]
MATRNNLTTQQNSNALQAFDTLGQFLTQDEWHPQQLEDKTMYRMGFSGKNGDTTCYTRVRVDLEQFLFCVLVPTKATEEACMTVAEFITCANYGLRIGNFEMDFGDGEVRYKSSIDFEGELLPASPIKNDIYSAVQTMDCYLPDLMSVIYGDKSPVEVIAEIEGK